MGWKYLVFALVALVLLEAALAQVDLPHHHAPQPPRRKQGKHSFHHTEEVCLNLFSYNISRFLSRKLFRYMLLKLVLIQTHLRRMITTLYRSVGLKAKSNTATSNSLLFF